MSMVPDGALVLRHRNRWEALDAGLLLWRENFAYLVIFFALPLWVCAFALRIFPERLRYLSWIVLWLLRPLFDRFILHVISIRFFENDAGLKRLCRGLGKTLIRGLAGDLTWRRFSPLRAAMMPVRTLEALKHKQAGPRKQLLLKGGLGFCSLLTAWSLALELALLGGELLFCIVTAEILQTGLFTSLSDMLPNKELIFYVAWCINSILVESLYMCMGFSLYLNSRVEMEGWDIEIMFRGFAQKHKKKSVLANHSAANSALAMVICLLLSILSNTFPIPLTKLTEAQRIKIENSNSNLRNHSNLFLKLVKKQYLDLCAFVPSVRDYLKICFEQNIRNITYTAEAPLETLKSILDSPDFGGEREGWGIRFKNQKKHAPTSDFNMDIAPWLKKIRENIALALRLLLIVALAVLTFLLILRLRKMKLGRAFLPKDSTLRALRHNGGESPELLLAKAREFFAQGDLRQAWGFCIAALFRSWTVYRGLAFPPDATEYECLKRINAAAPDESGECAVPVKLWTAFAYGGRIPPQGSFEAAAAYCARLPEGPPSHNGDSHE